MAKLTRQEQKLHQEAQDLLRKADLTDDEQEIIFKQWFPSADHNISVSGAFFTPFELAGELRIDAGSGRIIDLCAGIGTLAYWCLRYPWELGAQNELVCIEINPTFVEIGKKLLPQATWICADVFDVPNMELGHFDKAIANPPFGRISRHGRSAPRYNGSEFVFHVLDIASDIADYGAFIIPQGIAPFRYSGVQRYQEQAPSTYTAFKEQTAIELDAGCGIDTSLFQDQWKGTKPAVEIVCADFIEARERRIPAQKDLFSFAA